MKLFKRKKEIEYLDERLEKAQRFNNKVVEENLIIREQLIRERNELALERQQLMLDKGRFELEKKACFEIADMQTEHLTAELEFIKEHRMLPAECKFYSIKPKTPTVMKKLKQKKRGE